MIAPIAVGLLALVGIAASADDGSVHGPADELERPPVTASIGPEGQAVQGAVADGAAPSTILLSDQGGRVELVLDGPEPLAIVLPRDEELGPRPDPVPIAVEDASGNSVAWVASDGRIERLTDRPADGGRSGMAIRAVEANPDRDPSSEPRRSAVDVLHPDGSFTEIRVVSEEPGFTLTLVDTAGNRTPIEVGPDGRATLPDGVVADVRTGSAAPGRATDDGDATGDDPTQRGGTGGVDATRALALMMAGVAAGGLLYLLARRRRSTIGPEPFGPTFVGDDGVPDDRFHEFVTMLAHDADPGRAIRLAFSAAERGLGGMPRRVTTETPFEWCERVVGDLPHLAMPLRSLCDRFARTRFAAESPDATDRDAAVADLVELHRSAVSARATDTPCATDPPDPSTRAAPPTPPTPVAPGEGR